jgi:DNA-binding MarR family transcriptional regulator
MTQAPTPTLFDAATEPLPALPYHGTSGWSGSTTSETRAVNADKNGVTSRRQRQVLLMLDSAGREGLTWRDLSRLANLHHGAASGALSTLHKANLIARLTVTRQGCQVYVSLSHVAGRELAPYRANAATRALVEVLDDIEAALVDGDARHALDLVRTVRQAWQ